MKRVLLLVFLIISLVGLVLECDRIYLYFSTAALAGLVRIALTSRQHAQDASQAQALVPLCGTGEGISACFSTKQSHVAYTSLPHSSEDRHAKTEVTSQSACTMSDGS